MAPPALSAAIYDIVTSFYEQMAYVRVPPRHKSRLQSFLSFNE